MLKSVRDFGKCNLRVTNKNKVPSRVRNLLEDKSGGCFSVQQPLKGKALTYTPNKITERRTFRID